MFAKIGGLSTATYDILKKKILPLKYARNWNHKGFMRAEQIIAAGMAVLKLS